jgi:hypothetical protein
MALEKITMDIDSKVKKELKPMANYYGHRSVSPFLALKISEMVDKWKKVIGK